MKIYVIILLSSFFCCGVFAESGESQIPRNNDEIYKMKLEQDKMVAIKKAELMRAKLIREKMRNNDKQ